MIIETKPRCIFESCNKQAYSRGLCSMHYKAGAFHPNATKVVRYEGKSCSVEDCNKPARGHGYCQTHRARMARHGTPELIRRANGTGAITKAGYVLITVNKERIYEHIHIAEQALGRKLPAKAVVHHMNEKPADNHTPFNLVICPDQAYHMLLHKRARDLGIQW